MIFTTPLNIIDIFYLLISKIFVPFTLQLTVHFYNLTLIPFAVGLLLTV